MLEFDPKNMDEAVKSCGLVAERLLSEVGKKIVGQNVVGQRLLTALIAGGHVLLEGAPGLAKTTAIKALSSATSLSFQRIQFTPDLLPADVIGTQIYDPQSSEFRIKKGPVFAHLVLADEINRAPAKVQSALLQAMEEKIITIGGSTFELEEPFLVLATQNPIEQEGTYPLPEAQVDRFLFKLMMSHGLPEDEVEIIERAMAQLPQQIEKVVTRQEIRSMASLIPSIKVAPQLRQYIVNLVFATREPEKRGFPNLANMIEFGASPRASIFLEKAARVHAMLGGRTFVTPQDVKDIALDVMRHRVGISFEAEAENKTADDIVNRILGGVEVP